MELLESRIAMSAMPLVELGPAGHQHGADAHFDKYGNEYHWLPAPTRAGAATTTDSGVTASSAPTLADTFFLHSNPGAAHTIYLDFNGHTTSGTSWNGAFHGGAAFVTPAYSFTGDATFTDTELTRIQAIWQRVAEDFSPFNVNVTTEEPPIANLVKSGSGDSSWGVRVVIGGNGSWFGSGGGVAYVGSFNWSSDTPVFVFEDNLGNGNEKYTAEAISHEAGHALGLNHDGRTTPTEEYFAGYGSGDTGWAPIMGNSYYKTLTQWSKGEYTASSNKEDDLSLITTRNGFGYRVDDHANNRTSASVIDVSAGVINGSGIIERNTDLDYFGFSTGGGSFSLNVLPFSRGPNLDIAAALLDAAGTIIVSSNPATLLSATLTATLAAGTYYVSVDGVGKGDPASGGYSDYGSLGQYTLQGTIVASVPQQVFANNDTSSVNEDSGVVSLNVLSNDGHSTGASLTIASVSSGSAGGLVSISSGTAINYRPASNYFGQETFTYTVTDGNPGNNATATVTVIVAPVNDLPSASDDAYTTSVNTPRVLDVLNNDSILPDTGETLSIVAVSSGSAGGVLTIQSGTTISYTPASGFVGTETFAYTVNDGTPGSNATANVSVQVQAATSGINFNQYVVGTYGGSDQDLGVSAIEDGGATVRVSGNAWKSIAFPYVVTTSTVLEFDYRSTARGEIQGIGFDTNLGLSSNWTFQLYGTQTWGIQSFKDYATSAPNWKHYRIPVGEYYTGAFSYLFFANDHDVTNPTAEGSFSNLRVYEDQGETIVNQPPIASADSASLVEDSGPLTISVLGNDSTDAGETLTITGVTAPSRGGTVAILDGSLVYTPAADFNGTETFAYTINDGTPGNDASATVTINVSPQVDAVDDSVNTLAGDPVTIAPLANDRFTGVPDITSVTQGAGGSVVLHGDNTVTYTPNAGFVGSDSFQYTVQSGGSSETAVVRVVVEQPIEGSSINFNDYSVGSYGGIKQDPSGVTHVEDSGATLRITGNGWKQILYPYQITADTILEFDFRSPVQGEIHAIGFDNDLGLSSVYDKAFQVYGTQSWGNLSFKDYGATAPQWRHYRIPVGQYFTGSFQYLFFGNDHDVASPTADGAFANVRIFEASTTAASSTLKSHDMPTTSRSTESELPDLGSESEEALNVAGWDSPIFEHNPRTELFAAIGMWPPVEASPTLDAIIKTLTANV